MKKSRLLFLVGIVLALAFALKSGSRHTHSSACNPLGGRDEEDCLLPFPSSFFLKSDPATRTGYRVNLRPEVLPSSRFGAALDPAPYNERDGFSPAGNILAYFSQAIDPTGLPGPENSSLSLRSDSPIQLFRWDTGERVQVFAELDANATNWLKDRQALVIHPVTRLRPNTRYVVAIRNLKGSDGNPVEALSGFKKLKDLNSPYGGIFEFLDKKGHPRQSLQLAWDFHTASDESSVGRMVRMRDQVFRRIEREAPAEWVRVHESKEYIRGNLMKKIRASYRVPSYLVNGNGLRLQMGESGEPMYSEVTEFPLTVQVPRCARDSKKPLPITIYGHGTFNSGEAEMGSAYVREIANRICVVLVGTDWLGRAKEDFPNFLKQVLSNWNGFPQITDRLQQAHMNSVVLARIAKLGALNPIVEPGVDIDLTRIYYYGVSEGGCQGVTTLALSPDIKKGALNVPCGYWSMFFWRSSDFYYVRRALRISYPDALDQQKLMSVSQLLWDYTDPANYGELLIKRPLPGNSAKKILYQEAINDASVPNLTTRAMVRTIGLKLLNPKIEAVDGVEEVSGSADSAYVQFDVGVRPRLGSNNIPPPVSSVHEDVRRLESAKRQLEIFFGEKGVVEDTCDRKPCYFPKRPFISKY